MAKSQANPRFSRFKHTIHWVTVSKIWTPWGKDTDRLTERERGLKKTTLEQLKKKISRKKVTVQVPASFPSAWYELESLGKMKPQLRKDPHQAGRGQAWGSIFLTNDRCGSADYGQCRPWAGGPGCCKKAGWATHGEQASKQCPSMASTSAPASRFMLWVSALTSFWDGLWPRCGKLKWTLSILSCICSRCLITETEN